MTSWWRRNRIGLVAVAVLAPATLAVTFSTEWVEYYAERPSQPVSVAAGDSVDFAGTGWRVLTAQRFAAAELEAGLEDEVPPGSDLVVVTVEVTPRELDAEGRSPLCIAVLDELDGPDGAVQRTWQDAMVTGYELAAAPAGALAPSVLDAGYDEPGAAETACTAENTDPYTMVKGFVVPSDAGDDLALDLELAAELPRFLRLQL